MDALIISLVECEERKEKCEEADRQLFGKKIRQLPFIHHTLFPYYNTDFDLLS